MEGQKRMEEEEDRQAGAGQQGHCGQGQLYTYQWDPFYSFSTYCRLEFSYQHAYQWAVAISHDSMLKF